MSDDSQQQKFMAPPAYCSQPNYIPPPQPGYVIQGQPVHQGYVVQPHPPCGTKLNNVPPTVITVIPPPPLGDHMVAAILVTICCFFPTGIIAVLRASDAKAAAAYGDMQAADRHAKSAKKMINISIIAGIVCSMVLIGLMIVYFMFLAQTLRSANDDIYDK